MQATWSDANLVHTASSAFAFHEGRARGNRKAGAIVGVSRASVRLKSGAAELPRLQAFCKHRFRSDVTVFRLNARLPPKTGSKPAFRRNTAACVCTLEAAHNPEVAGSNPAATARGAGNGASRFGSHSRSLNETCGAPRSRSYIAPTQRGSRLQRRQRSRTGKFGELNAHLGGAPQRRMTFIPGCWAVKRNIASVHAAHGVWLGRRYKVPLASFFRDADTSSSTFASASCARV
jgi:hypothetical protein